MKTCLYKPLFINPAAYYVFPQLEDIQSKEDFIEKAVYAGSLYVQNDDKYIRFSNTSQIDLTEFAGSIITISQQDSEGQIIMLGQWQLNGEVGPKPVARYSAKGLTNSDVDRDILKDLSGNGHDIQLKNFGWTKDSGYNGADISLKYLFPEAKLITPFSINLKQNNGWVEYIGAGTETIPSYKIKVEGLRENEEFYVVDVSDMQTFILTATKDGIYTVPEMVYTDKEYILYDYSCRYKDDKYNIIVTIIPDYPDGLVFDGIDDYGFNNTIRDRISTVIVKYRDLVPSTATTQRYVFDFTSPRKYLYYTRMGIGSNGIIKYHEPSNIVSVNFDDKSQNINGFLFGSRYSLVEYNNIVLYDLIIYDKLLTPEEIQSEILKYNL